MGAWDVGLFADDVALDVREAWTEPVRRGRNPADVTAEVVGAFGADDPVVWLALADTQWRWGLLDPAVHARAVFLIDSEAALGDWAGGEWESARRRVLRDLRKRLDRPQPKPKAIRARPKLDTEWKVGEHVAYRMSDDRWTVLQVVGHDSDYGGRAPVCVLLDYAATVRPDASAIERLPLRRARANPLPWTSETLLRAIQSGVVGKTTTLERLNEETRIPYPAFTIGAFRKGERPTRRLARSGVCSEPRLRVDPRLALGIRWANLDEYLTAAFELPAPPVRGALAALLASID
jgi:hypothetical protein